MTATALVNHAQLERAKFGHTFRELHPPPLPPLMSSITTIDFPSSSPSSAPPSARKSNSIFTANSPALILAFMAIVLFTITIIAAWGRRLRILSGRNILGPTPLYTRDDARGAPPRGSLLLPERPLLWDLWTTKYTGVSPSANDWDIMVLLISNTTGTRLTH